MGTATNDDVVQQHADAVTQRDALAASLAALKDDAEQKAAKRETLSAELERVEGDGLIGNASDSEVKAVRTRHDAAVVAHRKAEATLRQAEHDLKRLDEAIERLAPDVRAIRIAFYESRQANLACQLRDGLLALVAINDELHENFREAESESPPVSRRGGGSPYPIAAGLTDLSLWELRTNPYAINGGRLGRLAKPLTIS